MSVSDEPWAERALCRQADPEKWFPEKGSSTRDAKQVCLSCDVRMQCLDYALRHDERFGVWGGLSERERRALKRRGVKSVVALPAAAERRIKDAFTPPFPHGTNAGYQRGCHLPCCKEAHSATRKQQRARKRLSLVKTA